MTKIHVDTGKEYDILIERGLISSVGTLVKSVSKAMRVAIITDSNVDEYYGETVMNSLLKEGYFVTKFVFKAGEESKNITTVSQMYDFLASSGITRKDLIIALGGGVTGDMAGYAAATFLRGMDFIQIPTSLLAQVDSSVGGKTGYDLPHGKNLVGAFWQPKMVIIDPDTLNTLPSKYKTDGMAEVIKYGCIADKDFFNFLMEKDAFKNIEKVIETCVKIKRDVVSTDERDTGIRIILNFGHTLGHAIEKLNGFKDVSHGQAVAIGMVMITKASEQANETDPGTATQIADLCKKYGLAVRDSHTNAEIAYAAKGDKKSMGKDINLVLLKEIGTCFVAQLPTVGLKDFITL